MVAKSCSACHGPALKGKLGPALTPEALAGKDTAMLAYTILNGRSDTPMPSWQFMINEAEARWLVEQLRQGRFEK